MGGGGVVLLYQLLVRVPLAEVEDEPGAGSAVVTSFEGVRPRRLLDWREDDGRCVLLRPRLGTSRVGRWLAGLAGDRYYRIRLDEVGTLVWKACDGRTSLADIARSMRFAFGARVEPADERLARFVRRLLKGRMIAVEEPDGSG